jgi:predicted alpha/beta hydrolase family esterase
MSKTIIIHGSGGSPNDCWIPWLKDNLNKIGFTVITPQFPSTPKTQTLKNWTQVINQYSIDENTILIGHSLGVPFILNILETHKVKACFLVAGFIGLLENKFDPVIKTFSNKNFDWNRIKENCQKFTVLHSNNDPYVHIDKAYELSKYLNIEPTLIPDAGHFNSTSNYYEFHDLLELIKRNN